MQQLQVERGEKQPTGQVMPLRFFLGVTLVSLLPGAAAAASWTYSASGGNLLLATLPLAGGVILFAVCIGLIALQAQFNQVLGVIADADEPPSVHGSALARRSTGV
jgi:hypothetical protein